MKKKKPVYEIPLKDYDFDEPPMFEYDRHLPVLENIERKNTLIQYARHLTSQKEYNNAILYYKYLSNNTYFTNDYYPYRQLTIIYDETKDYNVSMVNIKRLLHANIYLNDYQFIWFTERLRQLIPKTSVNEWEVEDWVDYYQFHGALHEKKLNKYLADRFIRHDDKIIVIDEDEYNHIQDRLSLEETGRIYERVGNYELAVTHYSNIIGSGEFNYCQFYQRLCLCLEKLNDYNRESKAIDLYYRLKPKNRTASTDEWFSERKSLVEQKLKSSLDYYFK